MRLKAFVLLGLACLSQNISAQRPSNAVPITPGSRVRVKTPTMVVPLIANFLEQRGDTLVFIEDERGRGVWSFGLAQIERLETSAGDAGVNRAPIAKGAAIGGGIGFVVGVAFAASATPSDSTKEYSKVVSGLAGAGLGAVIGAIVGSRVKSERWVTVPLPRQLSLIPNRRGGFTLSFGFR